MKVITMNTPQTEALNTKELSRKTVSAYKAIRELSYKAIRELLRAMISETPRVQDFYKQNLLDPNMGLEIRRLRL